jgi:antitoxin component YwqK of YwqJK toxin-antitoxin module
MDLYIISVNGKTTTYTKVEDIPFQISQDRLDELYKNSYLHFFDEDGEIRMLFSKDNKEVYNEIYSNPKPFDEDGFISISHYNKEGKLHSPKDNIPSVINTSKNEKIFHKNGKNIKPKIKTIFKDDYGEYTLLKNKGKYFKEVRCYKDGFRKYIKNNGDIEWNLNKELHSPSDDIPAHITYYENGSISSKSYFINGKRHKENGLAQIFYEEDGSIESEYYFINGKQHREDGPAEIVYNEDGSIYLEAYFINGEQHREDGPAHIEYYNNLIIREKYFIDGFEQN